MKNLAFILLITGSLFSCSTHDELQPEFCTGEFVLGAEPLPVSWKLVKMTGSIRNSETTGSAMEWQEIITLHTDSTFTKVRERDSQTVEASGTFSLAKDETKTQLYLTLQYASESNLIGSCYSKPLQEVYVLSSRCKLVNTWSMCDGSGLEYERQVIEDEVSSH